jgi:hypothetical protein
MAPQRLGGGSRRSYNPITGAYNAFFVSENAPIVRSVTAFGVSLAQFSLTAATLLLTDKQVAVAFLSTGFAEAILWSVCLIPRLNRHTDSGQPPVIDRRHHESRRARRDIRDGDEHLYDGLEDRCTIRLDGAVARLSGSTSDPWAAFGGCNLMRYLIPDTLVPHPTAIS